MPLLLSLLQLGVTDARVVDGGQLLLEGGLHLTDLPECERTVSEITLCNLRVDDFLHQVADALFGVFWQTA